jgi:hypothetical protein
VHVLRCRRTTWSVDGVTAPQVRAVRIAGEEALREQFPQQALGLPCVEPEHALRLGDRQLQSWHFEELGADALQ